MLSDMLLVCEPNVKRREDTYSIRIKDRQMANRVQKILKNRLKLMRLVLSGFFGLDLYRD